MEAYDLTLQLQPQSLGLSGTVLASRPDGEEDWRRDYAT